MAKKKEETNEEEVHEQTKPAISPLAVTFGQEDLNKLVEKVNEIIARFNA